MNGRIPLLPLVFSLLILLPVAGPKRVRGADEGPASAAPTDGVRPGSIPPELLQVNRRVTRIEAFVPTPLFDRHDPSNVLRHEGRYWMSYTRNRDDHREVSIHAASSEDGILWVERGEALGRGAVGGWDESGSIAPYLVKHRGKFHLFYTGFQKGDLATRELGCAIADDPAGPWVRWKGNPVLRRDPDPGAWDSGMLGDSNVIQREGRWWLYFKSRRRDESNRETRIGVAVAEQITGPYRKHPGNPLFTGHAFSLWPHRDGVAALCGEVSPRIRWSPDGLSFVDAGAMPNQSTGLFTPDPETDPGRQRGFDWGIEVYSENGRRGLRRFDVVHQAR